MPAPEGRPATPVLLDGLSRADRGAPSRVRSAPPAWTSARAPRRSLTEPVRRLAAVVLWGGLTAVVVAYGLGLPPVAKAASGRFTCAYQARTGHPCPACGYTRAWCAAAHGRWGEAWRLQPGGTVLFATLLGALVWAAGVRHGSRDLLGLTRCPRAALAVLAVYVAAVALGGWYAVWR